MCRSTNLRKEYFMKQNEKDLFSLPNSLITLARPMIEMSKSFTPLLQMSDALQTQAAIIDSFAPLLAATQSLEPSIKYFNENAKVLMQFADNISTLSKSLNLPSSQFQKFTETLQENADFISAVSATSTIAELLHSIDFNALFTSVQSEDINKNSDDYIITDSPVIKEFDISDNIFIPIGHNRIRIETGNFICLLSLLFTVYSHFFPYNSNKTISESQSPDTLSFTETQISYYKDTIILMQEQNQILLDILESVDASESSQSDLLEDIKESLQELTSNFQKHLESSESNQMSPELIEASPDTAQESHDSIQPSTDISPSSPSIGCDNE